MKARRTTTARLMRVIDRLNAAFDAFYAGPVSTVLIVALVIFDAWILYHILKS